MGAEKLLVVGSTSATSWGHHMLLRISEQARLRDLALVGMDLASRHEAEGRSSDENALFDELVAADPDDAADCARAVAARDDISAVMTIRELSVAAVAAIAQALRLRGNDPAVIERVRDKAQCRDWLRDHGFEQPGTRLCRSEDEAREFMRATGDGPWVVKPRDGLASIGVSLVGGPAELGAAIDRLDPDQPFLVETFVDGEELSAEGVMLGGRAHVVALTRKSLAPGGGFISARQRQPAGLPDAVASRASEDVARAVEGIGITHGHFHVELWLTAGGVVLGEMHARIAGDFIHLLVEETHPGLSMFGTLIDDLLGRRAAAPAPPSGAAGVTFLTFPSGTITAIDGWEAIRDNEQVVACDLQVDVGDTVEETVGSFDRPAVMVVSAATLDEVDAITDRLSAGLVVSTA
jgi:biotin carboxylase